MQVTQKTVAMKEKTETETMWATEAISWEHKIAKLKRPTDVQHKQKNPNNMSDVHLNQHCNKEKKKEYDPVRMYRTAHFRIIFSSFLLHALSGLLHC